MAVYSLMSEWLLWVFCNLMCMVTYLKFNIGCNGVKNCRLGTGLLGNLSRFSFFSAHEFLEKWDCEPVSVTHCLEDPCFLASLLTFPCVQRTVDWRLYYVIRAILVIKSVFCFLPIFRNVTPRPDSSPTSYSFQSWLGKHLTTLASLLAHGPKIIM